MGKMKEIQISIMDFFWQVSETVETEEDAWTVVDMMYGYLTSLKDLGIITEASFREQFNKYYDWADYDIFERDRETWLDDIDYDEEE